MIWDVCVTYQELKLITVGNTIIENEEEKGEICSELNRYDRGRSGTLNILSYRGG